MKKTTVIKIALMVIAIVACDAWLHKANALSISIPPPPPPPVPRASE